MQNKKRLIFAHRGLHGGGVPENSLAAFGLAVEAGLGIELDVQLTRDGVPVVFHDKTLKRMCGDSRRVSAVSFDEIRLLRLEETKEIIPTLKEVLELVDGRQCLLIETKLPKFHIWHHRLERAIVPLLTAYKGNYMMQSFNKYSMRYLKRRLPDIKCGILSGSMYPQPEGFDFISYKISGLTAGKATELKRRYPCIIGWGAYTFKLEGAENEMKELGLDGIIV